MKTHLIGLIFALLIPQLVLGEAAIFSGTDVKILKDNLDMNGKIKQLTGTADPTSSAVTANRGSVYRNTTTAKYYRKLDNGSSTNWVELGDRQPDANVLINGGFETDTTDWSAGGLSASRTTTAGQYARGIAGVSINASSATDTYSTSSYSLDGKREYMAGQNLYGSCRFKYASTIGTYLLEARSAGVTIASKTISANATTFTRDGLVIPGPASGLSVSIRVAAVAADEPVLYMDDCRLELAEGSVIANVSQASFFGGMKQAGAASCAYSENTSTGLTDYVDLGVGTGCNAWTTEGSVSATGTNDHRPILNDAPSAEYLVMVTGAFHNMVGGQVCQFRLSDGTNTYGAQETYFASGAAVVNTLQFRFKKTTAGTITLKLQASDTQATGCEFYNQNSGLEATWSVYKFPLDSQLAISLNTPTSPTIQKFISGTALTYTKPQGVKYIRVRMIGGGGGGAGSGTATSSSNGSAGNDSTFGSSFLTANGGGGAVFGGSGGSGGSASIGSGAIGSTFDGQRGQGSNYTNSITYAMQLVGGLGGSSFFGGGGNGNGFGGAGDTAKTNSGSGGQGGGGESTTAFYIGSGGGAAGFVDAIISSPAASYSYSVGSAGSGGSAGTGGNAGGAGAAGYIEVTEYYNSENAPLFIGSVTAPQSSGVTYINSVTSVSANYTVLDTDETILVDTSGADRTMTLPAAANVKGKKYTFKPTSSGNFIIIDPNSSETVCDLSTIRSSGSLDMVQIQSDGVKWISPNCTRQADAYINCDSSSAVIAQNAENANWISAAGNISGGNCQFTILTGFFSSIRSCVSNEGNGITTGAWMQATPVTNTRFDVKATAESAGTIGNATTVSGSVICTGYR